MQQKKTNKTALVYAVDLLAVRSHSEQELINKLKRRGYEADEIAVSIERLKERGYIDDTALCESLFEQYCRMQKYSLRQILYKLQQKGFDRELVERQREKQPHDGDFLTICHLLNFKTVKTDKELLKLKKRLYTHGFSLRDIEKAIEDSGLLDTFSKNI